jgi:hypothetical protein
MCVPLVVRLEESNRRAVSASVVDTQNLLDEVWPDDNDTSFAYVRFIDWYGDTVFNSLQMAPFLAEWERLYRNAKTEEQRSILHDIESLARRCQSEGRIYLRFVGD